MTAEYSLDLPYAYGKPELHALLKGQNAHFVVHEQLGFEPTGEGEHWYIQVENDGDNTQWIADQIAKALGVKPGDVGFCGLKDRNAITRQWFSVYDPKQTVQDVPALLAPVLPNAQILEVARSQAKLRRGMHQGNGFIITLVFENASLETVKEPLLAKLARIKQAGVPNYFGLQRFGRNGNNLHEFDRFLMQQAEEKAQRESEPVKRNTKKGRGRPRKPKGIILSSARSFLFNRVLTARVNANTWQQVMLGDVTMTGEVVADDEQCDAVSLAPTAPLWGRGRSRTAAKALLIEQTALADMVTWSNALEHLGLSQERRLLCSMPQGILWSFEQVEKDTQLRLIFTLPPGEYATGVLREICECYEPVRG